VVEDFRLSSLGSRDKVLVENAEDILADLLQLGLDPLAVLLDEGNLRGVALRLLLLLDRSNDTPRSTAGADDVLVSDRQEVPLLNRQVAALGSNDLHVLNHLCARSGTSASTFAGACGSQVYMPS